MPKGESDEAYRSKRAREDGDRRDKSHAHSKPSSRRHRSRSRSRSPAGFNDRREQDRDHRRSEKNSSRRPRSRSRDRRRSSRSRSPQRQRPPADDDRARSSALDKPGEPGSLEPAPEKQRPNFGVSGKLAAESNTVQGTEIVLKYHEPAEARKPPASQPWRLYVFKGSETLDEVELHQRSCWLFGREKIVADYHVEHPSVSKQHAVIQFRHVEKRNEFGDRIGSVKPYLIDLGSANGTRVAGKDIPESRYYELRSGDMVAFGDSSREYVIMLPPKE